MLGRPRTAETRSLQRCVPCVGHEATLETRARSRSPLMKQTASAVAPPPSMTSAAAMPTAEQEGMDAGSMFASSSSPDSCRSEMSEGQDPWMSFFHQHLSDEPLPDAGPEARTGDVPCSPSAPVEMNAEAVTQSRDRQQHEYESPTASEAAPAATPSRAPTRRRMPMFETVTSGRSKRSVAGVPKERLEDSGWAHGAASAWTSISDHIVTQETAKASNPRLNPQPNPSEMANACNAVVARASGGMASSSAPLHPRAPPYPPRAGRKGTEVEALGDLAVALAKAAAATTPPVGGSLGMEASAAAVHANTCLWAAGGVYGGCESGGEEEYEMMERRPTAVLLPETSPLHVGVTDVALAAIAEHLEKRALAASSTPVPKSLRVPTGTGNVSTTAISSIGIAVGAPVQELATPQRTNDRRVWLPEEDRLIRQIVREEGPRWRRIAACLPGRSDDAVRNRWNRTLREMDPDEIRDEMSDMADVDDVPSDSKTTRTGSPPRRTAVGWSGEEDLCILRFVSEHGHRWCELQNTLLPSRTEHAIRNRFHRIQQRSQAAVSVHGPAGQWPGHYVASATQSDEEVSNLASGVD